MTSESRSSASTSFAAVLGLVVFTVVTRVPALIHPRPIDDEQVYAVVARVMLQGGKPYLDAIERKPPLLFWLYRGMFALAGASNWVALHVLMLAWTFATMALLYATARRLWTPAAGWWAAALYSLFVMWGDYRTLALNGELLMNLPLVASVALAFGARPSSRVWRLGLAGALAGGAFLLKQPAGVGIVTLVVYAMSDSRSRRGAASSWIGASAAVAAFAAVVVAAGVLLHREGILRDAVYWTFLDHEVTLAQWLLLTLRNAPLHVSFFVISALPLLLGAVVAITAGLRAEPLWEGRRAEFIGVCVFLGTSIIGVASNGQFLIHYFLQPLPPLALLAAPVFAATFDGSACPAMPLRRAPLVRWLSLTAIAFFAVNAIGISFHRRPSEAAEFVREHSRPTDRLFVWGQGDQETAMYLDAGRMPASRYISIYPLTGLLFGSAHDADKEAARIKPEMWSNFERDVASHPPRFIIDADAVSGSPYPMARYPFLRGYLAGYHRVWQAPDGVVYETSYLMNP